MAEDLRTVHEVAALAGVSIRTLQYYDRIGLLRPSARTEAGYRLYGEADLARLQSILLFRELEFPLEDIRRMLDSPDFGRNRALDQQIALLKLKREHIDGLIDMAQTLRTEGRDMADFAAFDTGKLDEYRAQAKASWGATSAWAEYEKRSAGRTAKEERGMGEELMALFAPFAKMAEVGTDPASPEAQAAARRVQAFITEHFYPCTDEIFAQLGRTYGAGGEFTHNINAVAGDGAAEFAAKVIAAL